MFTVRLYKEHGPATIDALKRNPAVSVPLVLRRLEMKASELREARRSQQRVWNELNQKYHLKSLDHQGLNFKQTDTKQLRSKALLAEIESAFDEVIVCVSVCLSLCLSVCLCVCLSVCLSVYTSLCLFTLSFVVSVFSCCNGQY